MSFLLSDILNIINTKQPSATLTIDKAQQLFKDFILSGLKQKLFFTPVAAANTIYALEQGDEIKLDAIIAIRPRNESLTKDLSS
ncbi:MAG: hypothetical protein ACK4PR_13275, partial [Gammaproteobacteria bacterium]